MSTDADVANAFGIGTEAEDQTPPVQDTEEVGEQENATPDQESEAPKPSDVDSLPEWAQNELKRARREAADARRKARDAEQSSMTDAEKTKAEIRAEVTREFASKMAMTELRSALGEMKSDHVDDVLEAVNVEHFVTEDGEVDRPAVKAFAARILGARRNTADIGHGQGTNGSPRKRTNAEQFADTINGLF